MAHHIPRSWSETLGGVSTDPGSPLEVLQIRLGLVKDRCWEIGLREGQEVRFQRRSGEGVTVELAGGEVRSLELPYAWFVEVRSIASASDEDPTTRSQISL
jgi:hypothetical protein